MSTKNGETKVTAEQINEAYLQTYSKSMKQLLCLRQLVPKLLTLCLVTLNIAVMRVYKVCMVCH